MCCVSVIQAYMSQRVPLQTWTPTLYQEYQELIQKVAEMDKKLGQPDCDDPEKAAWMKKVEEYLQLSVLKGANNEKDSNSL